MLSLSKLTSSSGASTYFEVDDYYTKEEAQVELERTTSFQGELAKELQLPNFVDKQTFKDLLDGKVKTINGFQQLGNFKKDGTKERSAGTDMTFSAPKSLSILAEVLGKEELSKIQTPSIKLCHIIVMLVRNFHSISTFPPHTHQSSCNHLLFQ